MQIRVLKRIPVNEVLRRVSDYEEKYGGKLDEISEKFTNGIFDREAFEEYVEWMGMEQALGAYTEGEEFDYFIEELLELGYDDMAKMTPRRLELLDQLSKTRVDSINELAATIGRDVKNVYNDLKTLESLGFIGLLSEGRRLVPDLLVKEITFLTW